MKYLIIVTSLLLCAVTVRGNTEKPDEAKTQEHKEGESQTKPSNVADETKASVKDEQSQSTTVSGHEKHTVEPGSHHEQPPAPDEPDDSSSDSEDASMQEPESTDASNGTTADRFNNTHRPHYRRYIDLRKSLPIIERRSSNTWVRERPPLEPGETQDVNITRYAYYANGSRVALRSKYDYSYDDEHWFRSSRIKIPISQYPNGTTIFQYKFGPRRWIGEYRNKIFRNDTTTNYEELGYGNSGHRYGEQDSYFRPPPGRSRATIDHSYNGTVSHRKQLYKYGPPTERYTGYRRYDRRYPDRRFDYHPQYQFPDEGRWGQRGRYYEFYPQRPPYNDPRNAHDDPYYDGRRLDRPGDGGYHDRRYRPDGTYDDGPYRDDRHHYSNIDRRYPPGPSEGRYRTDGSHDDRKYPSDRTYDDRRRYPSDGAYDDREYQSDRTYDDRRRQPDDTRVDRKYPPEDTRDEPRSRAYDDRGPDRASSYERKRPPDRSYEDKYDRRRDRGEFEESSGSYNDSDYNERYRGQYQKWDNRRPAAPRRRPQATVINRPHGDSYEEYKWKFPYLDRNRIPEDERKRRKYFIQEYYDILDKTSKNLWKMHRNLRTILPDYEVLRKDGTISDSNYIVSVVNGSMTLLNALATKVNARMESNITIEDVLQPFDRGTYTRTLNNFDKMLDFLREYRKPQDVNEILENLMKKLVDYKKNLYVVYGDITHMVAVLRRTMKKYGFYVMGSGY